MNRRLTSQATSKEFGPLERFENVVIENDVNPRAGYRRGNKADALCELCSNAELTAQFHQTIKINALARGKAVVI